MIRDIEGRPGQFPVRLLHETADGPCVYRVRQGDRIAQLILKETPVMELVEVASVEAIGENRGGGFGSTGLRSEERP
jgi:dUTPase